MYVMMMRVACEDLQPPTLEINAHFPVPPILLAHVGTTEQLRDGQVYELTFLVLCKSCSSCVSRFVVVSITYA